MDFFSDKKLLVIASITNKEEKIGKKRSWVHNVNSKIGEHK
jgi:hypothetical protein